MLLIKTEVKHSAIQGLGLFAAEPVKKGQIIWQSHDDFTLLIPVERIPSMPQIAQDFIETYTYPHPFKENMMVLDIDNGRFMNHSDAPNTDFKVPMQGTALCDIQPGEELVCNYYDFDPTFKGFGNVAASQKQEMA